MAEQLLTKSLLKTSSEITKKQTTKVCSCGNTQLVLIQTHNLKWCPDCGNYIRWIKEKNQNGYY
jgi:predicted RNA-binding Zn-ribbon protein involved in translation (DUF1610 family)